MADAVRGVDPDRLDRPGPQVVGPGSPPDTTLTELLTPETLARFDEAERRLDEQVLGIPPVDGSDG